MKFPARKMESAAAMFMVAAIILTGWPPSLSSHGKEEHPRTVAPESSLLKLGAQLYDNWPVIKGEEPPGSHPLYPEEGKKQGISSWRCKECHGWDYIGRDGRYANGSHYTGIAGVLHILGEPVTEGVKKLTASVKAHDFSPFLSARELEALAVFLGEGLMDTAKYLDADGRAEGDAANGRNLYASHCSSCHGDDGNDLDFKPDREGVQGVGWAATDNPQESLHKIRWGHPGTDMPSAVVDGGLSVPETVDILAYAQTIP